MNEIWGKARKKPVVVKFRDVNPKSEKEQFEEIHTREGTLRGYVGKDYIIEGVIGEIYPIDIAVFIKTYDVIERIEHRV